MIEVNNLSKGSMVSFLAGQAILSSRGADICGPPEPRQLIPTPTE
ncbi:hypothetical protein OIE62_18070 [Streptomyces scopuliridis]|uniref:Uncharacterized protein n=1 Tax=Streptomyces scopuliridis TaxID=452529 RepID=A0ACD4ZMM9_9ACTN|nr:hypothetical protein [Streptomyces scopuliridis]WSB99567.1 hypothetical protein OG835_22890 [Streptomyces scopuliridis]WSC06735.1 hypothetical protein OIE62_18070 [Streptomyces scopuliridis]